MASMAKVTIIGNVGRDPEQRYTQSGMMTTSFSVAVNNRRRNPDGSFQDETEWYRVTAFGRLAEVCQQYVTKGSQLYVEGRLRLDRWTGQDGQTVEGLLYYPVDYVAGRRYPLIVITHGDFFHTFHLHGHPRLPKSQRRGNRQQ